MSADQPSHPGNPDDSGSSLEQSQHESRFVFSSQLDRIQVDARRNVAQALADCLPKRIDGVQADLVKKLGDELQATFHRALEQFKIIEQSLVLHLARVITSKYDSALIESRAKNAELYMILRAVADRVSTESDRFSEAESKERFSGWALAIIAVVASLLPFLIGGLPSAGAINRVSAVILIVFAALLVGFNSYYSKQRASDFAKLKQHVDAERLRGHELVIDQPLNDGKPSGSKDVVSGSDEQDTKAPAPPSRGH